jgi:3-hydroxyisobutyrate dehydrogenase-like beta-hydroxyacid dehydrogenase
VNVGLLHPGEMGAAIGAALRTAGHNVLWASAGRSEATRERASDFTDAGSLAAVVAGSDVVISVVPPHASIALVDSLPPLSGIFVDANAIAPATAARVGSAVERFVDGGIVGGPPAPRLYLSGSEAAHVAALFAGSPVETELVGNASALKCAYAGWTKGSGALLLAIPEFAQAEGVWDALVEEWARSQPQLGERLAGAERSAAAKGWRWVGEMEEIAAAFAADGLPPGFHEAAGAIYRPEVPTAN